MNMAEGKEGLFVPPCTWCICRYPGQRNALRAILVSIGSYTVVHHPALDALPSAVATSVWMAARAVTIQKLNP